MVNIKLRALIWKCPYCDYKTSAYSGRDMCPECGRIINKYGITKSKEELEVKYDDKR